MIEWSASQKDPVSITVFNINGKQVQHTYNVVNNQDQNKHELDVSQLPAGVYMVSVEMNGTLKNKMLIKK
jgi:hypothetical protein